MSSDRSPAAVPIAEYDTPWKIALEQHFEKFMAFYFPLAHAQIDWAVPYEFLDSEFQSIAKDALIGTRHVDKLVRVQCHSGVQDWLCIHVEVQVARESLFAQRMFVYNYRIFDRYEKPAASMALLGDDDPNWLPQQFAYSVMGCEMGIRFPVTKLAHYAGQEKALVDNPNPFALLTLAYLKNRATSTDMTRRYQVKCQIIRLLHAKNWDATLIRQFFLVIDWMMALPGDLSVQLSNFVSLLEEEKKMEYISSIERVRTEQAVALAKQEGVQTGELAALTRLLTRRFGTLPSSVLERIHDADQTRIETWLDRILDASSLDEVFQDLAH